jgi:protocatechuate 3,4-dioxygenase alpha subunit
MNKIQTPSQTIGPYFAYGLIPEGYGKAGIATNILVNDNTQGEHIRIHGQVVDGNDEPVREALLEIWQADNSGRYRHPEDKPDIDSDFAGFGRRGTDENGMYSFVTIKPGRVKGRAAELQAPHINMIVFMRGILVHAYTRIYFSDEYESNQSDRILAGIEASRRHTLIAQRDDTRQLTRYSFDIHLQGDDETVFFDL